MADRPRPPWRSLGMARHPLWLDFVLSLPERRRRIAWGRHRGDRRSLVRSGWPVLGACSPQELQVGVEGPALHRFDFDEASPCRLSVPRVKELHEVNSRLRALSNNPQTSRGVPRSEVAAYKARCFRGHHPTITPDGAYSRIFRITRSISLDGTRKCDPCRSGSIR